MSVQLSNNIIQPNSFHSLDDDNLISKSNAIEIFNRMFLLAFLFGLSLFGSVMLLLVIICLIYGCIYKKK